MEQFYEHLLPVQYIDHVAKTNPFRSIFLFPKSKDPRDGFYDITFQHFARAVDHLAFYLEAELGKNSPRTIGFLSHGADFRYMLLAIAALKTGQAPFFPSPRNSMAAQLSLLDQANCHTWLVENEPSPIVAKMSEQHPLCFVQIPSEKFFLTTKFDDKAPSYLYTKTFEEGLNDVYSILHTSGSTGIPKMILQHQSIITGFNALKVLLKSNLLFTNFSGMKFFVTLPWFHCAAYLVSFGAAMFHNVITVVPPACPMTAELVDSYHQYADIDITLVPPSILQEIAGNDSYLQNCNRIKYIANIGGPSTEKVGRVLADYTHPVNIGGSTEMGLWYNQLLDREDFMYWNFDPVSGIELRPLDDKHFELWVVRDEKYKIYRPIFYTFAHLHEWSSKDVFVKHPTKPNLWQHVGRTDDVIVLSTGEKVNPISIEGEMSGHPLVKGAIAFGEGRFEVGLLLEIDETDDREVRNSISSTLEAINRKTVAHGRISEKMVILSSPDKPFPRASKGTIQRKSCLKLYEAEIHRAYAQNTQLEAIYARAPVGNGDEGIAAYLERWITAKTGIPAPARGNDIFEAGIGMDSLLVARLSKDLSSIEGRPSVLPQDIYRNPSISRLAAFTLGQRTDDLANSQLDDQKIDTLLKKFSHSLPLNMRPAIHDNDAPLTVAVTGTTGSLGQHLLLSLLKAQPRVGRIYCLNRRPEAEVIGIFKQSASGQFSDQKCIEFLQIDLSQPRLGLSVQTYAEVARNIDVFIHNAWDVNFNKSIDSFEPHIHGVRQIIELCVCSRKGASLHFMSTMSTVLNWRPTQVSGLETNGTTTAQNDPSIKPKVPEQLYEDTNVALRIGYAESKHVSERLLAQACEESNIPITIYRLGQIAGPVSRAGSGCWPKQEWVPAMIQTSIAVDTFPSALGSMTDVDWVPVDLLSDAIVELALSNTTDTSGPPGQLNGILDPSKTRDALKVFHLVNPHKVSWSKLLPFVLEHVSSELPPQTLPLSDWVTRVKVAAESSASAADALQLFPVMKMLPFFESLDRSSIEGGIHLDVTETCAHSKVLAGLEAVKPEWMRLWMKQWDFGRPPI